MLFPGRSSIVVGGQLCIAAFLVSVAFGCAPEKQEGAERRDRERVPGARVYRARVVKEYPHDARAFTQGLTVSEGNLYEGTGRYGKSDLRLVDLKTGRVLKGRDLDDRYFGEGVTVFEDKIYQLTWKSKVGFVYNKDFEEIRSFEYPTEGWGLTHDGESLIMSDGTSVLRFLDPDRMEVTKSIEVFDGGEPVTRLNELEYIDGFVYANVFPSTRVAVINPKTGRVKFWVDLRGLLTGDEAAQADVANGIAFNAKEERLFVTGKLWPKLFEIDIVGRN